MATTESPSREAKQAWVGTATTEKQEWFDSATVRDTGDWGETGSPTGDPEPKEARPEMKGLVTPSKCSQSPSASRQKRKTRPQWAETEDQDEQHRVVGWRSGQGLTSSDVKMILRNEKPARHAFKGLQKATHKTKPAFGKDPLVGLPPTWQAFWSTVPHLDPQAAYRQFQKGEERKAKAKEQAEVRAKFDGGEGSSGGGGGGEEQQGEEDREALEAEVAKLAEEAKQKKALLAGKEKLCAEWDKKIARLQILEKAEEVHTRRVRQRLESASYNYGILEGKIRSSDIYFHFLYEDTKGSHSKKTATLIRANNLMEKEIDNLKNDVRDLLKTAAEALTSMQTSTPKELGSAPKGLSSNEDGLPSASSPSALSRDGVPSAPSREGEASSAPRSRDGLASDPEAPTAALPPPAGVAPQ